MLNPFDGSTVGRSWFARSAEFDRAADEAVAAAPRMRERATCERAAILSRVSAMLVERRDEVVRIVAGDVGKPIRHALVETDRAGLTFEAAADAARHLHGELQAEVFTATLEATMLAFDLLGSAA